MKNANVDVDVNVNADVDVDLNVNVNVDVNDGYTFGIFAVLLLKTKMDPITVITGALIAGAADKAR